MSVVVESLGWAGAVTVLGGYLLFSSGRLPNGPTYQLLNLVGAVLATVNVLAHHAWPSTIVNSIWALIAAVVLVRMMRAKRRTVASDEPDARQARSEPATTTVVLPVIGPAIRTVELAEQAERVEQAERTEQAGWAEQVEQAARVDSAGSTSAPRTGTVVLTDNVPVVTAAITVALVAATREEAARQDRLAGGAAARERGVDA